MGMTFEMINMNGITGVRVMGLRHGLAGERTHCSYRGSVPSTRSVAQNPAQFQFRDAYALV